MSLSCALLATSLHQWARRYLRLAHRARCSPEKRARMRAFFANGVEKMHVPWAVEGLPTMLHLSLFLFFGGLVVFLFNIDQEVFTCVVWWIGLFSAVYGLITFLPIIRHDSPYNSPLSTPAWFLYTSIHHMTFKFLAFIAWNAQTWQRYDDLRDRYQGWMLGGVEKAAEDTVSERSSEIDVQILDWTISALGDDDSLKSFFEAIPGFFNSNLVKNLERDSPEDLLRDTLYGFIGRTWSSNSISDSAKLGRLDIAMNAMSLISHFGPRLILWSILDVHWDEVPQTVEMGRTLARWCTSSDQLVARHAQVIIARILVSVRERNDSWVTLASQAFGLPERDLWDSIALGGDSVLFSILIHVTRQSFRSGYSDFRVLGELSKLDIWNTHPRLLHEFCTLWNEIVQEARNRGLPTILVFILREIRHLYIILHQGTDAAPTAFTGNYDAILLQPSSYPLCDLASHRPGATFFVPLPPPSNSPDASSHPPTDGGNTASRQANVVEPLSFSHPTTTRETGATSHGPDMTPPTNPIYSNSRLAGTSPIAVVATAAQDITSTVTSFPLLEGSEQQDSDLVESSAEPGTSQILFTASTHAPTHTLTPIPNFLSNTPSEPHDTGVTSVSDSSHSGLAISKSRNVPFPAQPDDSATAIIGPPPPSDPTTTEIRDTSQAFPIAPKINSGGSRPTFASPPPAGSHHDRHDQSQIIPMEVFRCHQAPDIVLDSLEYEGRQHGLN